MILNFLVQNKDADKVRSIFAYIENKYKKSPTSQ